MFKNKEERMGRRQERRKRKKARREGGKKREEEREMAFTDGHKNLDLYPGSDTKCVTVSWLFCLSELQFLRW